MRRAAVVAVVAVVAVGLASACGGGRGSTGPEAAPLVAPAPTPASVASAPPVGSSLAPAPAGSASTPRSTPPPELQRVAEEANVALDAVLPRGRLGEATAMRKDPAEKPTWVFPRLFVDAEAGASPMGEILVVTAEAGAEYVAPRREGPDRRGLGDFIAASKLTPKIIAAATKVPEVAAMCREAEAQGSKCTLWPERMGHTTCPKDRKPTDDCTWEIYVGSNMGSHVSRLATIWVDPGTMAPTAASDLGCPPMTMTGFKKKVASSRSRNPTDDCPGEIKSR